MNSNEFIVKRLERPKGLSDVVIDTDTFNEEDDQFALSYLIRSDDKLNLKAIYAAPFKNHLADTPEIGMEKSYKEISNIVSLCGRPDLKEIAYRGSAQYLKDENTPVDSDAARNLVERAMAQPNDRPLYVVSIGCITNIASAILMQPEIIKKIVIVWLGGHAYHWPDTKEFNMYQDIAAARVVFGSTVPMVHVPCMGVVDHLATCGPEMKHWIVGKNELCDYLYNIVRREEEEVFGKKVWSRVIWDVAAVAWLLNDNFTDDTFMHSPIPTYDNHYSHSDTRHFIKYVYNVNRDAVFEDLFKKLVR